MTNLERRDFMSEIYLPNYIANAESIRILTSSPIDNDLVAIRIRNYKLLSTVVSSSNLQDTMSLIQEQIKDFYAKNAISNFKITLVQDYIFITSENIITHLITKFIKALYSFDFPIYISFQLIGDHGKIAQILPRSVQQLVYSDHVVCPAQDADCNNMIAREYRTLSLLQRALNNKTAGFAYQPIIDSSNGSIAYHECLMRFPDANGQWVSAGPAIILAEKYGIISMVDDAAITMAYEELKAAKDLAISVNISNVGLLNDLLLEKILILFKQKSLAERLIIEVTETSKNEDITKTNHFVNSVRSLGIRVALDDFGVGTTSFKQLCAIKFDIIKIDGSFIKDVATNPYHRFITEMVVKLSKDTGAKTVAEFVENGEVAKILIDLEVDFMQGHFFSPARNFRSWNKTEA